MTTYCKGSGKAITTVQVSNYRSVSNIEVELNDLTVLIGANNAGKTSFLGAIFAAIGTDIAGILCLPVRAKDDAAR